MKKVLDFLEQNVQWLTLGLGVVFVLWMAYSYLLSSDHVTVKIDGEELTPGSVDRHIVSTAVDPLRNRMNNSRVPPMNAPSWVEAFQNRLAYAGEDTAVAWVPMFPVDRLEKLEFRPSGDGVRIDDVFVEQLPPLPAAVMQQASSGRSNVLLPDQVAQAPAGGGDAAAAGDGGAVGAGAQVQPVAQQQGVDKLWVTVMYRIPMGEIAAAFTEAKVPLNQYNTTVLKAELWRQEQQPDGSWDAEQLVEPLPTVQIPPMPSPNAPTRAKMEYLRWANANTAAILQPPFYQVAAGDTWFLPTDPAQQPEQPVAQDAPFDPNQFLDAPFDVLMKLTPEQRRLVAIAKAKRDAEERKNRGRPRDEGGVGGPRGGGLGGGPRGGGPFGPNDGGRPGGGGSSGGDPDIPGGTGGFIDPGAFEGGPPPPPPPGWERYPGEAPPMMPQQEQPRPEVNYPIPNGEFDPRNQPDAICWAHDDTIEAGKTYRYKVIYSIKSPVWNTLNMTKPAELAEMFALQSDKLQTEWSEPISMEGLTKFFVLRQAFQGDTADVQVFRWHGGRWQTKTFDLAPGDAIGFPDSEVDFSTGWTLVDMRRDPRTEEPYAVLMDRSGKLHTRNIRADANDPELKRLQAEANAAAAAAAPPPPGGVVAR